MMAQITDDPQKEILQTLDPDLDFEIKDFTDSFGSLDSSSEQVRTLQSPMNDNVKGHTITDLINVPFKFFEGAWENTKNLFNAAVNLGIPWAYNHATALGEAAFELDAKELFNEMADIGEDITVFAKEMGAQWVHDWKEFLDHPVDKIINDPFQVYMNFAFTADLASKPLLSGSKFLKRHAVTNLRGKINTDAFERYANQLDLMQKLGEQIRQLPSNTVKFGVQIPFKLLKQFEQIDPAFKLPREFFNKRVVEPISFRIQRFKIGRLINDDFMDMVTTPSREIEAKLLRAKMEKILKKRGVKVDDFVDMLVGKKPINIDVQDLYNEIKSIVDKQENSLFISGQLSKIKLDVRRHIFLIWDEYKKRFGKQIKDPKKLKIGFERLLTRFRQADDINQVPLLRDLYLEAKRKAFNTPIYFPMMFENDLNFATRLISKVIPIVSTQPGFLKAAGVPEGFIKEVDRVLPRMLRIREYYIRLMPWLERQFKNYGIKLDRAFLQSIQKKYVVTSVKNGTYKFNAFNTITEAKEFADQLKRQGIIAVAGTKVSDIPLVRITSPDLWRNYFQQNSNIINELAADFKAKGIDAFNLPVNTNLYERIFDIYSQGLKNLKSDIFLAIPDDIARMLRNYIYTPNNAFMAFSRNLNQLLYSLWLYLRPAWAINQIIGNTFLTLMTGGNIGLLWKWRKAIPTEIISEAFFRPFRNIPRDSNLFKKFIAGFANNIAAFGTKADVTAKSILAVTKLNKLILDEAYKNLRNVSADMFTMEGRIKEAEQLLSQFKGFQDIAIIESRLNAQLFAVDKAFIKADDRVVRITIKLNNLIEEIKAGKATNKDVQTFISLRKELDDAVRELDVINIQKSRLQQDLINTEKAFYTQNREAINVYRTAIKEAQRTLSAFLRASPIEKAFMPLFIPFWSFIKTMTLFSYRFPFEHPIKAWVASTLPQTALDTRHTFFQNRPYLIPFGFFTDESNRDMMLVVDTRAWNPILSGFPIHRLLDIRGQAQKRLMNEVVGAVNPFLKIALESESGFQSFRVAPFRNGEIAITLHGRQLEYDDQLGQFVPASPAPRLWTLLYRSVPQFKFFEDLILGKQIDFNSTIFNPVFIKDRFNFYKDRPIHWWEMLGRQLGVRFLAYDPAIIKTLDDSDRLNAIRSLRSQFRNAIIQGDEDRISEIENIMRSLLNGSILLKQD